MAPSESQVFLCHVEMPEGPADVFTLVAGAVPPEDIIGAPQVSAGKVVAGSYRRSPQHRILSERGFFRLSPWLHERLVAAMCREGASS